MANKIIELFGDTTLSGRDLITTPGTNLNGLALSGAASAEGVKTRVDLINRVVPRVDYSDFSNFVFFNSALDYFNVSGDRIINEYPYDGTYDDILAFQSQSDAYQNYLLKNLWPKWSGALALTTATGNPIVIASDTVIGSGVSTLAPGTGSFTIEFRYFLEAMPASSEAAMILQLSPNVETPGYLFNTLTPQLNDASWNVYISHDGGEVDNYKLNLYLSGAINENTGGSVFSYDIGDTLSGRYVSWVVEHDGVDGSVSLYLTQPGSNAKFTEQPFLAAPPWPTTFPFPSGALSDVSSLFVCGSGTAPAEGGYTSALPELDISELRYWNIARTQEDIFTTYNTRVYKDDTLGLYWRFAEPYHTYNSNSSYSDIVKDYSGNGIDGTIQGGDTSMWVAASTFGDAGFGMRPQDIGEPVLSVHYADVVSFVTKMQWAGQTLDLSMTGSHAVIYREPQPGSAMYHDKNNANIITNLVPKQFLLLEDDQNTQVLKNLLYLLGRQFDEIKVYIDQMTKLFIADQSGFNTTPDALLDEALQFWGWDTSGNFLNKEAFQYLFGLNVIGRSDADISQQVWSNEKLDTELFEIKNEFWRRTLNSLPYIYKKKGTKEAVNALLRIYGLDSSAVKLKEFGYKPNVKIQTQRINGVKSATARKFISGSTYVYSSSDVGISDGMFTFEMQMMMPPSGSSLLPTTLLTGTIFSVQAGDNSETLYYTRPPNGQSPSYQGTLTYTAQSPGTTSSVTFPTVNIFDGRWYDLNVYRSGTLLNVDMRHLDGDVIDIVTTLTGTVSGVMSSSFSVTIGNDTTATTPGELWARNVQVWHMSQSLTEKEDHTLNPFSVGTDTPDRIANQTLWWKFDELIDSDNSAYYASTGSYGVPGYHFHYIGSWVGGSDIYGRFNLSYNFIAPPDMSWTEEKIRYIDNPNPKPGDHWMEVNDAAIELNLIDALNEDISTILSSLDNWNNMIGQPASRYRDDYQELQKLRQQYFSRLSGRINFRAFADFMDFFDRSFLDLIKRLIPARVDFKGAELVVESHMLERPKVQYGYRPHDQVLVPEGLVRIYAPYVQLSTTYLSGNSP